MDGHGSNGKKYHDDAVATGVAYGDTYTTNDAIGVALMLIMEY